MISKIPFYGIAVFILSVICLSINVALIFYGWWLWSSADNSEDKGYDHGEKLSGLFIIAINIFNIIITCYGMFGCFMKREKILVQFAVISVLLMFLHLILFTISYFMVNAILGIRIKRGFDELSDDNLYGNGTLSFYENWLQCCGKNSAEDYLLLDRLPPPSCCRNYDCTNIMNLNVEGCEIKLTRYIKDKTEHFNILSALFILFKLLNVVDVCLIIDNIRNQKERDRLYP